MKGFIEVTVVIGESHSGEDITEKLTINLIDIRNFKSGYGDGTRMKLTYEQRYTWLKESYQQIKQLIQEAQ